MKNFNKTNIKRIVIIIGILIIPLMYSYFYLSAFWDPYSKLESLPVAVVNKDKGATINSVERNIGKELQNKMTDSNELNFCFVSEEEANKGLTNGKYYATIVIPSDFSKDVSTASEVNKSSATLIYSPNEKTNYLASQILGKAILLLSDELKTNVVGEVVTELSGKLDDVPGKLNEINDGVSKLYDGAKQLNDGTVSLTTGTNTLNTNYKTFNSGVTTMQGGFNKLNQGSKDLDNGISSALVGAKTLKDSTKDLYKIDESVKALNVGTTSLNTSTNTYVGGVNQYIAQSNEIGQKIGAYVASNPSAMLDTNIQYIMGILTNPSSAASVNALVAGGDALKAGTKTLNDNLTLLSNGTKNLSQVNGGISSLTSGLETLKAGSGALTLGMSSLQTGMTKLSTSSNDIMNGISTLNNGANKLNNGSTLMKDGLKEANTKIKDGINTTNNELEKLNGITEFAENPIKVEQQTVNTVPNYGTAFAAYFMSLSLWVGGLIIFVGIYLDADEKFKILSRHSDRKILRTFIYLLIGIAQALLLAAVLRACLKLTVVNIPIYYISCILVSVVFISIIQFFMINFKDAGKFVVILLLILQLTSCGGTFPMELVPGFFNKLFAFMPMTYSVNLFKEAISGGNSSTIVQNILILSSILVVFISMTIVGSKIRKNKEENVVTA